MMFRTQSAEETATVGSRIAANLKPPAVVMLIGDLGVGKTTLAKGIVSALGTAPAEDVLSPTFSLVHEYEGDPKIYHLDLYRLDSIPQLETLGLEDLWDQPAVVIVEWGEKFGLQLPGPRTDVFLEYGDDDSRVIRIQRTPADSWEAPSSRYNPGEP